MEYGRTNGRTNTKEQRNPSLMDFPPWKAGSVKLGVLLKHAPGFTAAIPDSSYLESFYPWMRYWTKVPRLFSSVDVKAAYTHMHTLQPDPEENGGARFSGPCSQVSHMTHVRTRPPMCIIQGCNLTGARWLSQQHRPPKDTSFRAAKPRKPGDLNESMGTQNRCLGGPRPCRS